MEVKNNILNSEDFIHFKKWIGPYCSPEGKYSKEFEEFWSLFFKGGQSLSSILEKFKRVKTSGTISTWFSFMSTKLICYSFVYKEMSIGDLSKETGFPISKVATILRNFFVETFPYLENYFNEVFHLNRKRKDLLFQDLVDEKKFSKNFPGVQDEDIMKGLDVASLHDWPILVKRYKRKYLPQHSLTKKLAPRNFLKKNSKIFIEVFFLVIGGIILIKGTALINKWYERKLAEKINIFEIQGPKIKNDLSIGKDTAEAPIRADAPVQNLDEIVKNEEKEESAFNEESDVVLTSWKTLPKDFAVTNNDKSDYEEETNTAARDITSGNKKVYRVIMESISPGKTKTEIDNLLLKYKGTQVDSVKPGTYVPGGLYYNVLIPQEKIKEFLYNVMNTDESTLYETRTRLENPPGKGRVFIWIKVF